MATAEAMVARTIERLSDQAQTDDDWEVFNRRTLGRLNNHLRVGMDKTGKLSLSPKASSVLGSERYILILLDRQGRRMALRRTSEGPNSFKISPSTRQVNAARPLRELAYDFAAGPSWVTPQIDGDLLIIDLAEAEANRKGRS